MKISSLFNLVTDAQDILDLFDGITTTDQLRSRLGRVRQLEAEDLLACLDSMRASVTSALDDTLEMSPELESVSDGGELDESLSDDDLERLASEPETNSGSPDERQNPNSPPLVENEK